MNSEMSEGTQRGWKIYVPEANVKTVDEEVRRMVKTYNGKMVKIRKSEDQGAVSLEVPGLSEQSVKMFYQLKPATEGVYLITFVKMNNRYLASEFHPKVAENWKKVLQNVARNAAIATIEAEINEAKKELTKQEKELNGLKKDKKDYEQDIRDCEQKMLERKKDVVENEKAQVNKQKTIDKQKSALDKIRQRLSAY